LLIPAAALAGAVFVVVADLLARTLAAPSIIPLGVVTALVGGPFFLWLLRYAGRQYTW
jgi:iron complex transport system permease protein